MMEKKETKKKIMERFVRESFDIEDSKYYWYTGWPDQQSKTLNRLMDFWAESQRDGRIFASGIYLDCKRLPKRNKE